MITANKILLEINNLSNNYEGFALLQNVSFTLEDGEILCLLGPSGSGKTTLLRLLAGLENEENGTIFFRGTDIKQIPPHKRNFGMMFQEYALFPHKNVAQNVAFGLEMKHLSTEEIKTRVQQTLKLVGLTEFADRKIDELSGGEKQRVALARSLAPEPQLLLLDEPLGSLDKRLRDRLASEIRAILKSIGMTSVFVTHDQSEAFSVADKIAILHNGILQQFDTPENIYRNPVNIIVAKFLGFQNLIEGSVDKKSVFHSPSVTLHLKNRPKTPIPDTTLLIRPEGAKLIANPLVEKNRLQLSGIITNRQFQGSTYKITVKTCSQHLVFDLPIEPPPPDIGRSIHLEINPSALILISEKLK